MADLAPAVDFAEACQVAGGDRFTIKHILLEEVLSIPSEHSVKATMDRLVISLQKIDLTIYARINRQLEAGWFDLAIRPFEVLLLDHPWTTALLLKKDPLCALDLPLRIIVWEDDDDRCWVAFKSLVPLFEGNEQLREHTPWRHLNTIISKAAAGE